MDEYLVWRMLNGNQRKLLIINQVCGEYKIYWDSIYLGNIKPVFDDEIGVQWSSDDDFLKEYAQEIGEYIERKDS